MQYTKGAEAKFLLVGVGFRSLKSYLSLIIISCFGHLILNMFNNKNG